MRDRRAVVAAAGVLFARANRELSSLLTVRAVVVHKGGSVSKSGIKRDQSMGFGHSYSYEQRMDIGELADAELREYNAARVKLGCSHANGPPPGLPPAPPSVRVTRPREKDDADDKENLAPSAGVHGPPKKKAATVPPDPQPRNRASC